MKKMMKNRKGFTLMEMLIVVAIIAILIAIAIPSFTTQLEKAREAADIANIRSAYAEAMVKYLDGKEGDDTASETPAMTQSKSTWDYVEWPDYLGAQAFTGFSKGDKLKVTITSSDTGKGELTVSITKVGA